MQYEIIIILLEVSRKPGMTIRGFFGGAHVASKTTGQRTDVVQGEAWTPGFRRRIDGSLLTALASSGETLVAVLFVIGECCFGQDAPDAS